MITSLSDSADRIPFAFVLPEATESQLETLHTLDVERDWQQFERGVSIWCLQTFLELRDRGWPVALTNDPLVNCVNLVHVRHLRRNSPVSNPFIVSIQADCPNVQWTAANIVQNRLQEDRHRSIWIPHWPQPGLIPRSPGRNRVACAAYAGDPEWLAGTERQWAAALGSLGIEFRCLGPDCWNDYSTIDVLVGVRSFDQSRYDYKPASKLLNAWLARIPLVAGYDSAFEQIGQPGCDYLRVSTLDAAVDAIRLLRDDPTLYQSIVDAGAARTEEYTRDRIADAWTKLLSGPIKAHFLRWKETQEHARSDGCEQPKTLPTDLTVKTGAPPRTEIQSTADMRELTSLLRESVGRLRKLIERIETPQGNG